MRLLSSSSGLREFTGGVFVPTMGALHEGHAALIRRAREIASSRGLPGVVVSVFVNPTQFNDPMDFERYPRTLEADLRLCEQAGASAVYAPPVEEIYPPGAADMTPALPEVATEPGLEDAHRPGHFAGVCRVCRRLFELVEPRAAVFGEKDWQQLAVIRAMVQDLGAGLLGGGLEIIGHPTVRESDGVAMSSRNRLLTPNHRRRAAALSRALAEAGGCSDAVEAERAGRAVLLANRIVPEYLVVRDAATLRAVRTGAPARALVAAKVGDVRLIDNAEWPGFTLSPEDPAER